MHAHIHHEYITHTPKHTQISICKTHILQNKKKKTNGERHQALHFKNQKERGEKSE